MQAAPLAAFVAISLFAGPAYNQKDYPNSSIVSSAPCRFGTFEEQSSFTKRVYSKAEFDAARNSKSIECLKIQHLSDGLKVVGFIVRPRNLKRRYPVIVYNRGGLLDIGKIDTANILDFYNLAKRGFVVLASQYRGNDGGEGHEELGGSDVHDVLNLLSLASSLTYADSKNVFLYGMSRGGMMTMLALKNGAAVNAAAVVGGVFDLENTLEFTKPRAPQIAQRIEELIPNYSVEAVQERSAIDWPERVNVPLLIIHGGEDEEVPISQTLAFAAKLSALHKAYELVIYANDTHEVTRNRQDRDAQITAWFRHYLR